MWAGPCGAGERHRKGCGVWCSGLTRRRSGASAPSRAAPAPDLASTARPVASPLRGLSAPSCLPSTNEYPGCPRLPGEHAASSSADATTEPCDSMRCDAKRSDALRCDAIHSVRVHCQVRVPRQARRPCAARVDQGALGVRQAGRAQCNAMRCDAACHADPNGAGRSTATAAWTWCSLRALWLRAATAPTAPPGGSFVLPLAVYRAQRYTRRSAAATRQCRVAASALHLVGT